jgi:hypothetical protein
MTEKIPNSNDNKEKFKRTVDFLIGGEVKSFDRDTVIEDFRIADIVRIQPDDFPNIKVTPGSLFTNFNYAKTVNRPASVDEPERKYLIVKIVGPGQPEPLLTLEGALIAECVEAESGVPYEKLTDKQLSHSLPGRRDIPGLLAAMQESYGRSRGLSPKQIEDAGVGYTLFRILGPAPASNVAR